MLVGGPRNFRLKKKSLQTACAGVQKKRKKKPGPRGVPLWKKPIGGVKKTVAKRGPTSTHEWILQCTV